jgi:hypothetical protein
VYRIRTRAASSTSWNRSRSPVTTSTGMPSVRATIVPMTSSASYPGDPTQAMPNASSSS